MKLTTKSEYALICLKYIILNSNGHPISVAEISEAERLPRDYVEQIFVRLRKAGVIRSVKGIYGGFVLARDASEITLKEVIETLEGSTFEIFCSSRLRSRIVCEHFSECSMRPFWLKLKKMLDDFCQSVTLASLLEEENALHNKFQLASAGAGSTENKNTPRPSRRMALRTARQQQRETPEKING